MNQRHGWSQCHRAARAALYGSLLLAWSWAFAQPADLGQSVALNGTKNGVAACVACHGETGLGVESPLTPKPAVLAGQHVDYLEQALTAYRNGRRKNVVMDGMAKLLTSDEDVKIAAEYFADQASPLATASTDSK